MLLFVLCFLLLRACCFASPFHSFLLPFTTSPRRILTPFSPSPFFSLPFLSRFDVHLLLLFSYVLAKWCTSYFVDNESRKQHDGEIAGCVGEQCFYWPHVICAIASAVATLCMLLVAYRSRARYGALRREALRVAAKREEEEDEEE